MKPMPMPTPYSNVHVDPYHVDPYMYSTTRFETYYIGSIWIDIYGDTTTI
jgi:hypothetical protein